MEIHPLQFLDPRLCIKCNRNGNELFDQYGNALGYRSMIEAHKNGLPVPINGRPIYKMKCINCNSEYRIIWRDGFPYPDYNTIQRIDHFTNLFKGG